MKSKDIIYLSIILCAYGISHVDPLLSKFTGVSIYMIFCVIFSKYYGYRKMLTAYLLPFSLSFLIYYRDVRDLMFNFYSGMFAMYPHINKPPVSIFLLIGFIYFYIITIIQFIIIRKIFEKVGFFRRFNF